MGQKRFERAVAVLVLLMLGAAGGWASAQALGQQAVNPPRVLAGQDVGFRIEAQRGNVFVGRVVVRVNGEWVDTEPASGPVRLRQGSN